MEEHVATMLNFLGPISSIPTGNWIKPWDLKLLKVCFSSHQIIIFLNWICTLISSFLTKLHT